MSTPPPVTPAPGLTAAQTQQIQQTAQTQAAQELQAAESPYQSQIDQLTKQQKQATSAIDTEFSQLMPQVQSVASGVQSSEEAAANSEQQVFAASQQQLNNLAQQQAAQAQQMAQQIGGPVSPGQFTQALTPYQEAFPSVAAGGMLNALGMAQAGSQEAQAFAGQVFPAMQTEQQAQNRNFYQDKIGTAQDAIDRLETSKAGLVNDKYNTLLQNEQQFNLDQAKLKLDQNTAAHNWAMQKQTLKDDIMKNKILAGDYGLKVATTKAQIAKIQAQTVHWNNQDQLNAEKLGITKQHYMDLARHYAISDQRSTALAQNYAQKNAMALIDAAMGTGKPIEITQKLPMSGIQRSGAILAQGEGKRWPDVHYDGKTHTWYQYQTVHMTPQQWAAQQGVTTPKAITDPQQLYSILIGAGTPKGMAKSLVEGRTGIPQSQWGKTNYTTSQLHGMTTDELKGIVVQRGLKAAGQVAKATRQSLIDLLTSAGAGG